MSGAAFGQFILALIVIAIVVALFEGALEKSRKFMAMGQDQAESYLRAEGGRRFVRWIGTGLSIAGLTGAAAFLFGRPFLTSAFGHPSVPLLGELPLASVDPGGLTFTPANWSALWSGSWGRSEMAADLYPAQTGPCYRRYHSPASRERLTGSHHS